MPRLLPLRMASILVALLAAVAVAGARAATVTVLSQNTLHLGWGKPTYQATKSTYVTQQVVGTTYGVVLLQEVMAQTIPLRNTFPWQSPSPGTYLILQSSVAGASSYKETYGFLVNSALNVIPNPTGHQLICYTATTVSRPPCGVLVQTGTTPTWFIDYHAIFGSPSNRAAEVTQMGSAIVAFQNTAMGSTSTKYARAVMGGDWNFDAATVKTLVGKTIGGQAFTVAPTAQTSLTPTGALSQPYDHFICTGGVTCASDAVVAPPGGISSGTYRTTFSDHLGVKIDVQY